jgi:hypothetical protein
MQDLGLLLRIVAGVTLFAHPLLAKTMGPVDHLLSK